VLGLAVATLLYERFPDDNEGALAKRHTALVQQAALAAIAREIGLPDAVRLSDAERGAGGARKDAILADALEAVIAAVFVDGGFAAACGVVGRLFAARLLEDIAPPEDPKTMLQEWAQSRGLPLPSYEVTGQSGPDHAPLFRISVTVEGFAAEEAEAHSKRAAEKTAAARLLDKIGERP
jgi:ribonuclease III